jgi:hypothetical protein
MLIRPRVISAFLVLILIPLVVAHSLNLFPRLILFDFYQYWGVAVAHRTTNGALGNPFTNPRGYHAALNDQSAASSDPKLAAFNRMSGRPGFTATPFLYMLLAALPADYSRAALVFHVLQVVLFVAGVVLLGAVCAYPVLVSLPIALTLVLASGPVSSDLRLGNLGCFQFAALTGILALSVWLRRTPHVALGAVVITALALLALAKPNIAPAVGMMALAAWWALGLRRAIVATVPGVLAVALAVAMSGRYFGSWTVWLDWYHVVFGRNPYTLVRPAFGGNYSSSRFLSSWLHLDVWVVVALTSAGIALSWIALTAGIGRRTWRDRAALVWDAIRRTLDDPRVAAAIGVTVGIALPPLFWYHYLVIAVIPGLWLLNVPGPASLPLWGLVGLAMSSGVLNVLFLPLGWAQAVQAGAALSWIPLWGGILHYLRASAPAPVAMVAEADPSLAPEPPVGLAPSIAPTPAAAPVPRPADRGGRTRKAKARSHR